ncbi:hypothetical protein AAFC00_002445 [Neodothiora populina]|uniref:Altered inheritance of mitochondria protein 41 n=1 Tax=Neodothiora populina TaxID=2781224 RepID=A0ABR3P748_9PEZI
MQVFTRARPCLRQANFNTIRTIRYASTTTTAPSPSPAPPAPALLLKMREDLKTAMRAKDTARLNVLRGVFAEITNAAKTSNPVNTDMQLLSLLRKRSSQSAQAAKEFEDAGRSDLKDKEEAAISILEAYSGSVETVGVQEIRNVVVSAIKVLQEQGKKLNQGEIMKSLLGPNGAFEGKNVEKAEVAKVVKEVLAT